MTKIIKKIDDYFNYNRQAWLKLKEMRFKQIRDNKFYLDTGVEIFKNEVMKFWEGKDDAGGWNYRNSEIKKRNGEWIYFQNENGEIPKSEEIIKNLEQDNLKLHGNYSWSMLHMGGDITVDMQKLKETRDYLFNEKIDITDRLDKAMEIPGMGKGKASMLLHVKYPDKYGVWNSCTEKSFKILSKVDSNFRITGADNGEKYKKINKQLKWLLKNYKNKDKNNNYGFKNLSDVDIFIWYIANNF